ncbi:unnamed protein product [Amoebophrya sp. A25]|nr:unnamed protein product [Amoebophrya sp. A25]|eukprot:GSA25T00025031001.1
MGTDDLLPPDEVEDDVEGDGEDEDEESPQKEQQIEVRPRRKNLTHAQYREKLFGNEKVYVVIGDKLRQVRSVLDAWGWVENQPTNPDDRLVFDFCWSGRAARVDGLFGYLPPAQCVNHFRGSGQFDSKAGMLLSLRKCGKGCLHEFYPPSYDLRSSAELEAFFCDAFFHRIVSQRHTKAGRSVLRRLLEKRQRLLASTLKDVADKAEAAKRKKSPRRLSSTLGSPSKNTAADGTSNAASGSGETTGNAENDNNTASTTGAETTPAAGDAPDATGAQLQAVRPRPVIPVDGSMEEQREVARALVSELLYGFSELDHNVEETTAGDHDNVNGTTSSTTEKKPLLPTLVPFGEGVNPRAVNGIEACVHEYCSLFEQAQRGPVDDIPTYLEATARPWMTTYLESCISRCSCCVTEHQLRIEQSTSGRVCVFGKAIPPVDRNGNPMPGYKEVALSNAKQNNSASGQQEKETPVDDYSSPRTSPKRGSVASVVSALTEAASGNSNVVVPGMTFGSSPKAHGRQSVSRGAASPTEKRSSLVKKARESLLYREKDDFVRKVCETMHAGCEQGTDANSKSKTKGDSSEQGLNQSSTTLGSGDDLTSTGSIVAVSSPRRRSSTTTGGKSGSSKSPQRKKKSKHKKKKKSKSPSRSSTKSRSSKSKNKGQDDGASSTAGNPQDVDDAASLLDESEGSLSSEDEAQETDVETVASGVSDSSKRKLGEEEDGENKNREVAEQPGAGNHANVLDLAASSDDNEDEDIDAVTEAGSDVENEYEEYTLPSPLLEDMKLGELVAGPESTASGGSSTLDNTLSSCCGDDIVRSSSLVSSSSGVLGGTVESPTSRAAGGDKKQNNNKVVSSPSSKSTTKKANGTSSTSSSADSIFPFAASNETEEKRQKEYEATWKQDDEKEEKGRQYRFIEHIKDIFKYNASQVVADSDRIDQLYDYWCAHDERIEALRYSKALWSKGFLAPETYCANMASGSSADDERRRRTEAARQRSEYNARLGVLDNEYTEEDAYLDLLLDQMPRSFHTFYGDAAAYIFKSPHLSRGRGLKVMTCRGKLRPMLEEAYSRSALNQRWFCIVQKYLEKPFLCDYKGHCVKCDLRLWVACLNWNPLVAIVQHQPYFRLATKPFGFSRWRQDQRAHLTNRTIQEGNGEVRVSEEDDPDYQLVFDDFMAYLEKNYGRSWVERWEKFTWPLMLDATRCALLASQDAVVHAHYTYTKKAATRLASVGRNLQDGPKAFELYGIDFSLDYELRPWLLEANCGPDLLGHSGPMLKQQARTALDELFTIVLKEPRSVPVNAIPHGAVAPNVTRQKVCCDDPNCFTRHGVQLVPPALVTGWQVGDKKWSWFLKAPRMEPEVLADQFARRKAEEWSKRAPYATKKSATNGGGAVLGHEAVIRKLLLDTPFVKETPVEKSPSPKGKKTFSTSRSRTSLLAAGLFGRAGSSTLAAAAAGQKAESNRGSLVRSESTTNGAVAGEAAQQEGASAAGDGANNQAETQENLLEHQGVERPSPQQLRSELLSGIQEASSYAGEVLRASKERMRLLSDHLAVEEVATQHSMSVYNNFSQAHGYSARSNMNMIVGSPVVMSQQHQLLSSAGNLHHGSVVTANAGSTSPVQQQHQGSSSSSTIYNWKKGGFDEPPSGWLVHDKDLRERYRHLFPQTDHMAGDATSSSPAGGHLQGTTSPHGKQGSGADGAVRQLYTKAAQGASDRFGMIEPAALLQAHGSVVEQQQVARMTENNGGALSASSSSVSTGVSASPSLPVGVNNLVAAGQNGQPAHQLNVNMAGGWHMQDPKRDIRQRLVEQKHYDAGIARLYNSSSAAARGNKQAGRTERHQRGSPSGASGKKNRAGTGLFNEIMERNEQQSHTSVGSPSMDNPETTPVLFDVSVFTGSPVTSPVVEFLGSSPLSGPGCDFNGGSPHRMASLIANLPDDVNNVNVGVAGSPSRTNSFTAPGSAWAPIAATDEHGATATSHYSSGIQMMSSHSPHQHAAYNSNYASNGRGAAGPTSKNVRSPSHGSQHPNQHVIKGSPASGAQHQQQGALGTIMVTNAASSSSVRESGFTILPKVDQTSPRRSPLWKKAPKKSTSGVLPTWKGYNQGQHLQGGSEEHQEMVKREPYRDHQMVTNYQQGNHTNASINTASSQQYLQQQGGNSHMYSPSAARKKADAWTPILMLGGARGNDGQQMRSPPRAAVASPLQRAGHIGALVASSNSSAPGASPASGAAPLSVFVEQQQRQLVEQQQHHHASSTTGSPRASRSMLQQGSSNHEDLNRQGATRSPASPIVNKKSRSKIVIDCQQQTSMESGSKEAVEVNMAGSSVLSPSGKKTRSRRHGALKESGEHPQKSPTDRTEQREILHLAATSTPRTFRDKILRRTVDKQRRQVYEVPEDCTNIAELSEAVF